MSIVISPVYGQNLTEMMAFRASRNRSKLFKDTEVAYVNPGEAREATALRDLEEGCSSNESITAELYGSENNGSSPTVLTYSNMGVTSKIHPYETILNNMCGTISAGLWAIMGPRGSGKTTLLGALSLRLSTNVMSVTGELQLNGRECDVKMMKSVSAYVMQDDVLHAELTVEETLRWAAQLRMAPATTDAERDLRVQQVTDLMGIGQCAKTVVGNTRRKGISSGERKRLCVAIELLNRPKLIFLDEPTSGLDAADAFTLCNALKNLSTVGECTTVCTIHQPAPNIFAQLDNLILMKSGEAVYQGNVHGVTAFLQEIRRPCPCDVCLPNHLLETVCRTDVAKDKLFENSSMSTVPVDLELGREMYDFYELTDMKSLSFKTWILCQRNMQLALRNYRTLLLGVGATLFLAFLISGGAWQHLGNNQASTSKIPSALFFTCVNQGIVASFMAINSFPGDRVIMLRERQAGAYTTLAYFLAKSLTDTALLLPLPILFSVIVYPMFGLQPVASKFFLYMMFMVLVSMAATALATMVTCLCVTVEMSAVVLGLLYEVCRLYRGFFTSPLQLEVYPGRALAAVLSYIKYAFVGVALNELSGRDFVCDPGEVCKVMSGEQIAAAKGYDHYTIGYCAGMLVLYAFSCRVIAFLALKFVRS